MACAAGVEPGDAVGVGVGVDGGCVGVGVGEGGVGLGETGVGVAVGVAGGVGDEVGVGELCAGVTEIGRVRKVVFPLLSVTPRRTE